MLHPPLRHRKPCTRVENKRDQPSIIMKRSSLNGIDIIDGGSIIIPIDISVDETTISISIKGM